MLKKLLSSVLYLILINLNAFSIEDNKNSISNVLDLPGWTAAISAHNDGLSDGRPLGIKEIEGRIDG